MRRPALTNLSGRSPSTAAYVGAQSALRCALGKVDSMGSIVLAPEKKFINGRTANHGAVGYGETVAIAEDGSTWFLAGLTSVGAGEYLQVSTGVRFSSSCPTRWAG